MKEKVPKLYKATNNLICDQTNEEYYIVHYRNLKTFLRRGMIITKVHRIVSFDQSPWLEKYIEDNTKKKAKADLDFRKDYLKCLGNSSYGKTTEDVRKRIRKEFVKNTGEKTILRFQSRLDFDGKHKSYQECDSYKKKVIQMDEPIYLAFVILELSKLLMYERYYDELQKYFTQDVIQVHYQDTDSIAKSVKTTDVENDLGKLQDQYKIFDFSNMNKDHKLFSDEVNKIPGYSKIETPTLIYINKFVCFRSKCCAYKTELDGNCNIVKSLVRDIEK